MISKYLIITALLLINAAQGQMSFDPSKMDYNFNPAKEVEKHFGKKVYLCQFNDSESKTSETLRFEFAYRKIKNKWNVDIHYYTKDNNEENPSWFYVMQFNFKEPSAFKKQSIYDIDDHRDQYTKGYLKYSDKEVHIIMETDDMSPRVLKGELEAGTITYFTEEKVYAINNINGNEGENKFLSFFVLENEKDIYTLKQISTSTNSDEYILDQHAASMGDKTQIHLRLQSKADAVYLSMHEEIIEKGQYSKAEFLKDIKCKLE